MDNEHNITLNEILTDILKEMYSSFGNEDMSTSLSVNIIFDETHRVSKFDNLTVDGLPKMPTADLVEKINLLSASINELPEKYKLTSCRFSVEPGGNMNITPVYSQN